MSGETCSFRDCGKPVRQRPSRRVDRPFCCAAHRRAEQAAIKRDRVERIGRLKESGMSMDEIAAAIGLSKGRIKTILHEQAHPRAGWAARRERDLADKSLLMEMPPARIAARLAQMPECERRFVEWEILHPWIYGAVPGDPHAG